MALDSSILIYGHDPTLLDTRRWVLESAGYTVVTVSERMAARDAMTKDGIALCILCHTLTPAERRMAMAMAMARQPELKTLSFCITHQAVAEDIAGATIDTFQGAEGLIAATKKLVS